MLVEKFGRVHIFATCEGGNIYKIARFSKNEICDEYEVWSHVGNAHGYRFYEDIHEEEYIDGDYVEPMTESQLQRWLQGCYCEDVNRMLELMTPMMGKIHAFIYISTHEGVFPPYVVFKQITATEICDIVPITVDDVAIPRANSEFFALSAVLPDDVMVVCEQGRLKEWQVRDDDPSVIDRSFLQRRFTSSNQVVTTKVLTWSFEGNDSFKLTEEPKYYIIKGEENNDRQ